MFHMDVSSDISAEVQTVKTVTYDKTEKIEIESRIVPANRLKCADLDRERGVNRIHIFCWNSNESIGDIPHKRPTMFYVREWRHNSPIVRYTWSNRRNIMHGRNKLCSVTELA